MKWSVRIYIYWMILFFLTLGCQAANDNLKEERPAKTEIAEHKPISDQEILVYLEQHLLQWNRGSQVGCAYRQVDEEEGKIYLRALCLDDQGSGISVFLVLKSKVDQGKTIIISHQLPKEGAQYQASFEKLFPTKVRGKMEGISIPSLEQQAKERLKNKQGDHENQ